MLQPNFFAHLQCDGVHQQLTLNIYTQRYCGYNQFVSLSKQILKSNQQIQIKCAKLTQSNILLNSLHTSLSLSPPIPPSHLFLSLSLTHFGLCGRVDIWFVACLHSFQSNLIPKPLKTISICLPANLCKGLIEYMHSRSLISVSMWHLFFCQLIHLPHCQIHTHSVTYSHDLISSASNCWTPQA